MKNQPSNRFESGILKVVAFIGLARFVIALLVNDPSVDGYADLYLDIATALVFFVGLILVHFKARSKYIIGVFFIPLIGLFWTSLHFHNGLVGASEINAFAIVIILSLTIQGRLPWIFVGIFLLGVVAVLYFVEQQNLNSIDPSIYNLSTYTLLLVTIANIGMTFHAKNVFDSSRAKLSQTNESLMERRDEIQRKREQLTAQNEQLNRLKEELEEKVLERTKKLKHQKKSIGEYMQLTLTELMKPYEKTINEIKNLENPDHSEMINMAKASGEKLEIEVENLKKRLLTTHE